jgi:hypothetical protein
MLRGMSGPALFATFVASAAVAVAGFALVRWRRAARIMGTRILIGEAMRRRGITPADAAAAGLEAEVFAAGGRCAQCAADPACRRWLGDFGGTLPTGCPNRDLLDRIAARKASSQVRQRLFVRL